MGGRPSRFREGTTDEPSRTNSRQDRPDPRAHRHPLRGPYLPADHTLEPNALVNELCVRPLGTEPITYNDRAHFFAGAAQTMRRILIDHARARVADKRGGIQQRVSLSAVDGWNPIARSEDLLALDEVLANLEKADPRAARVVELRFFGGLSEDEVAEVLGVSAITVKRDWRAARAWLIGRLQSRLG
jgi:RNA polymerase sigma-70 factor (ECF subfamily)